MIQRLTYEELEERVQELEKQVAEQQRSWERLEESNIQMLDMLESISDGFFSLDAGFVVTYFNGAAERLLGRKSWEILGHNLFEAFPEIKGSIFEDKYREALRKKTPLAFETYFPVVPYENWYDVRVYPRRDGISVFFQVTTENHRLEEARKQLGDQLRKAEKAQAVAELAGGVANDFNNLLSVIQSSVSMALFDLDASHPQYETFKRIETQARNGARLSAQLLGYARKGRDAVDLLDLAELTEDRMEAFAKTNTNIRVERNVSDLLPPVEGNRYQILEVLDSILQNSLDAMPYGGKLTVRTEPTTHEHMDGKPWNPRPGAYVLIRVEDTGIGMDKDTQRQVFTPFFTTKARRAEGSGLGMAAVYGIVKGHGGYIDVSSEPGKGTIVSVFLPCKAIRRRLKKAAPVQLASGNETVLLVDDESLILEVGSAMLSKLGYTVMQASGGRSAVDLLQRQGEQIAVIILDMIMGDMGGNEVFKRIKEMNLRAKIILATGCSLEGQVMEMLTKGCDGFLQKPFGIRELSEKVRDILDQPSNKG
jgi:PAS domain S-box-containing protein